MTTVDGAVKRLGISKAPSSACEHAGQCQERIMSRSFRWPVARKECDGGHPADCGYKHLRIYIRRRAFEALLESDSLARFMDAGRDDSLQSDRPVRRQPAQLDQSFLVQRVMKLHGANRRVGAIEKVREGFRMPPEDHTGFREEFAGRGNHLEAIAVYVGASVLVTQMQPMFCGLPLKYCGATLAVISRCCQP